MELPIAAAPRLEGLRGGIVSSRTSFEQIYAVHVRFVCRTLRALGVPAELVEDAAQDVFVVVHRRLSEFDGLASPKAWLFQIARRVARGYRRTLRRKGGHETLSENLTDNRPDAADRVAHGEDLRLLEDALDELEEKRRAVLVLSEIEQMSAPEIARMLDMRLNTVYSRLRRAREDFQRALEQRKERA